MAKEPLVVFTPSGKRGHFPIGTPILTAARKLGVDLDSVCGGRGICSKCQVTPSFGNFPKHGLNAIDTALSEWNSIETKYHEKRGLKKGRRLGCQAQILADIVIDVPSESQVHKQIIRKAASEKAINMAPATKLYYIEVAQPDMQEPSGDLERLSNALREQWKIDNIECEISILQKLQKILRKSKWKITVALHRRHNDSISKIIEIWPGLHEGGIYGLAIDLGSTTIAAHLVDLRNGKVISSAGIMNPQIRFGEDLMSRVSYSMMNEGGCLEMTRVVREQLNKLFSDISKEASIEANLILETVFVCNPVMHHLLLGIDPVELGQAPFALTTSNSLQIRAYDLEIDAINSCAQCFILPCIAGHVGADAAAVALSENPGKSDERVLIVDVGTNAEILLGDKSRVLACSSPTGPAFEGAQISSGQRAAPGAIERVEIDPISKEPRFKIIGCSLWSNEIGFKDKAQSIGINGICGSGIIEALAEMRLAGLMDKSGLLGSPEVTGTSRMIPEGRTFSYVIYDGAKKGEKLISVTQNDVRAIQLAKSALYAGAKLLMDEMGIKSVQRIVLAGAFGAHISPKHALILGMIPDVPLEKVFSAGNAAGTGARIALCNVNCRAEIEEIVRQITKIETAIEPKFQEHFVAANAIPHASDKFTELNKKVSLPEILFNVKNTSASQGRRQRRRK